MPRNTSGLWLSLLVGSVLILKLAPAEEPAAPSKVSTVEVRVTERNTDGPIAAASIAGTVNKKIITGKTDAEGVYRFELPSGTIDNLSVNVSKPSMASMRWSWFKRRGELPTLMNFALDTAMSIGGVIQDEQGNPIDKATVSIILPNSGNEEPRPSIYEKSATTDRQGRWHLDGLPSGANDVWIRLAHSAYVSDETYNATTRPSIEKLRDRSGVMVMRRGISVSGRVLDGQERPIAGATVRQGHDRFGTRFPEAKTDENGSFTFAQVKPGPLTLTIQAAGHAPDLQDINVGDKPIDNLDFRLKPGCTLRGKVVDGEGKPIVGAFISADTWRQKRSLNWRIDSDAEGRFVWNEAPDDEVLMDIGKQDYMSIRHQRLKAGDDEQTIVLNRPLEIRARIVDDATGRPVAKFDVIRGIVFENGNGPYWQRREAQHGADGKFTLTFTQPYNELMARFEALGYAPAVTRKYKPTDGRQEIELRMKAAPNIAGLVRNAEGQPVANVPVAMINGRGGIQIYNGRLQVQDTAQTVSAANGTFELPPQNEPYLLVATNDYGFAEAAQSEFEPNHELKLRPWGRLEGRIKLGQHGPNANVAVSLQPRNANSGPNLFANYSGKCDGDGKFVFERVLPGPVSVALTDGGKRSANGMTLTRHLRSVPAEIEPGQTATVNIGGEGRTVTAQLINFDGSKPSGWNPTNGNLKLKSPFEKLPFPDNYAAMSAADKKVWIDAFVASPEGKEFAKQQRLNDRNIPAPIDSDGSLTVEVVPAGTYQLMANIYSERNEMVGRIKHEFTVSDAAGMMNDPMDLGELKIEPFNSLAIGAVAPDIEAETVTGEPFKLSELKGKFVLLDFWATWCGPCIAEIPNLRDVYETFGKDDRFALVSLSLDDERKAATDYVEAKELKWMQVHLGAWSKSETPEKYGVLGIPAMFLIGPDGRVISKELRGSAIKLSVAAALAKPASKQPAKE